MASAPPWPNLPQDRTRAQDPMHRREFLKGLAVASTATATGLSATLLGEREARAFGELPEDPAAAAGMVPKAQQAQAILEIFLYGGVSQFESFYCVPEHGADTKTHWHLYAAQASAAATACGFTQPPLQGFAADANGKTVHFGPNVMPLRLRPDVMARTRVSITKHDLEPHEAAIPLMLGGRGLGDPALSGLGAHIQRFYQERELAAARLSSTPQALAGRAPYAYVLQPNSLNSIPTDNLRAATAIGLHPGSARPLSLKIDAGPEVAAQLARGNLAGHRPAYDSLVDHYVAHYRQRLRWRGEGQPLRSPRVHDLAAAAASVAHADAIAAVLQPSFFTALPSNHCGKKVNSDAVTMNLKLAAHLLTHETAPARYVCVMDGGLIPADGGGGYDSHDENPNTQARNLTHTLGGLMAILNAPGENDPTKLDLDKTLIVLTTEFGRAPQKQGKAGRNHWPYGFPVVLIGGPVRAAQAGVFGATGADGHATLAASPQENRIAALLAVGIWPFSQEAYNVADVPGATSEADAARRVRERQLGIFG